MNATAEVREGDEVLSDPTGAALSAALRARRPSGGWTWDRLMGTSGVGPADQTEYPLTLDQIRVLYAALGPHRATTRAVEEGTAALRRAAARRGDIQAWAFLHQRHQAIVHTRQHPHDPPPDDPMQGAVETMLAEAPSTPGLEGVYALTTDREGFWRDLIRVLLESCHPSPHDAWAWAVRRAPPDVWAPVLKNLESGRAAPLRNLADRDIDLAESVLCRAGLSPAAARGWVALMRHDATHLPPASAVDAALWEAWAHAAVRDQAHAVAYACLNHLAPAARDGVIEAAIARAAETGEALQDLALGWAPRARPTTDIDDERLQAWAFGMPLPDEHAARIGLWALPAWNEPAAADAVRRLRVDVLRRLVYERPVPDPPPPQPTHPCNILEATLLARAAHVGPQTLHVAMARFRRGRGQHWWTENTSRAALWPRTLCRETDPEVLAVAWRGLARAPDESNERAAIGACLAAGNVTALTRGARATRDGFSRERVRAAALNLIWWRPDRHDANDLAQALVVNAGLRHAWLREWTPSDPAADPATRAPVARVLDATFHRAMTLGWVDTALEVGTAHAAALVACARQADAPMLEPWMTAHIMNLLSGSRHHPALAIPVRDWLRPLHLSVPLLNALLDRNSPMPAPPQPTAEDLLMFCNQSQREVCSQMDRWHRLLADPRHRPVAAEALLRAVRSHGPHLNVIRPAAWWTSVLAAVTADAVRLREEEIPSRYAQDATTWLEQIDGRLAALPPPVLCDLPAALATAHDVFPRLAAASAAVRQTAWRRPPPA